MATYNKYISDEIPVINVPAEGKTIETQYYIGLEKQDEDKEFINNINEGTIENTTIDWCNIQYNQVDDTAKQIKLITTTNLAENERDCEIRFFNSDFSDNDVKIKIIQAGANFEFAYYNISGTKIIQNNTNETLVISNDNINTASEIFKFKFGKKENRDMGIDDYDTFEDWYNNYIHDELIGFYNFCIIKGFVPNILNPDEEIEDKVFYEDDEGNKQIVFEGNYDECRRWCKYNGWSYRGFELQLEIE